MKKLFLLLILFAFPFSASSYVSGIDDVNPNIDADIQQQMDSAITSYYAAPSMQKVNTVLDLMTTSDVLRKKTAWAPLTGFLTIIFTNNPEHIMQWLSRNDYNNYAIDIIVAALMHAKHKNEALEFAKAEQWDAGQLAKLENTEDTINLKKLTVVLPGHIDTLWGAFFASGDEDYVNKIIDVLFMQTLPDSSLPKPNDYNVLGENKALATKTLKYYAAIDKVVKAAITKRIKEENDTNKKDILNSL